MIPLPHPKWIESVTAVVVRRDGHDVSEAILVEHARTRLASFKVPKAVHSSRRSRRTQRASS